MSCVDNTSVLWKWLSQTCLVCLKLLECNIFGPNCPYSRAKDADQSEARRFLWRGVKLGAKEETGARDPSVIPSHADFPGWGWETAQTSRHQAVGTPIGVGRCGRLLTVKHQHWWGEISTLMDISYMSRIKLFIRDGFFLLKPIQFSF